MKHRTLKSGPLRIEIGVEGSQLRTVDFPKTVPPDIEAGHLRELLAMLGEFEIAFDEAPPFHRKVWQRLRKIPWGSALTYSEMAAAVGSPKASRAVGQACAANLLPIIVPCHRILAQDGLGGFSGGLDWKRKLLELETEK